jgi:hypothetical protein
MWLIYLFTKFNFKKKQMTTCSRIFFVGIEFIE